MFLYREKIRYLLENRVFDVRTVILSEAGSPGTHIIGHTNESNHRRRNFVENSYEQLSATDNTFAGI